MLLAIDIGNTNISFGLSRCPNQSISTFNIPTQQYTLNKLKAKLGKIVPNDAIICSVVPKRTGLLSQGLKTLFAKKPYIIGRDIIVPIKNLYHNPKQVGQDRLVNAYAASKLYGAPLIAVDFGTAITFDVVSRKSEYLGGMILPGLKMSLEALNKRTALLPKIKLEKPNDFIGKDTKNSMLSGIIYGFSSLTDELIMRIRKVVGRTTVAVATGGNAEFCSKYCRRIDKIDTNLTLKGLNMLYLYYKKNP